jgi:hypothetical protein
MSFSLDRRSSGGREETINVVEGAVGPGEGDECHEGGADNWAELIG